MTDLSRLERGAALGARWVARHQRDDGGLPSQTQVVEGCYKGIWALTLLGYTPQAMRLADRVLGWVDGAGDIPEPRQDPAFFTTHYLYANTYLAIGAQVLGRFDLGRRLYGFIRSRQHEPTGGFLSQGPAFAGEACVDTVSTCISSLTALYHGDLATARRGAEFLENLFALQPELDRAFYPTVALDGELITPAPEEVGEDDAHRRIDIHDPEQEWYFLGLATVFLPHLYEATGEEGILALAERYLDYLDQACCPGAFTDFSSGKSGVGAAHLYRLTGRERYREIALAVADFILDLQLPWGCWQESPQEDQAPPEELVWSDMDMTAEYVLWLKQILRHLQA